MPSRREREEAREVLHEFGHCKCWNCKEAASELIRELGFGTVERARRELESGG